MNKALDSIGTDPELCNSLTLLLDMGAEVTSLSTSRGVSWRLPISMTLFANSAELVDREIDSVQFLYLY